MTLLGWKADAERSSTIVTLDSEEWAPRVAPGKAAALLSPDVGGQWPDNAVGADEVAMRYRSAGGADAEAVPAGRAAVEFREIGHARRTPGEPVRSGKVILKGPVPGVRTNKGTVYAVEGGMMAHERNVLGGKQRGNAE